MNTALLRRVRKDLGLSQEALARKTGVSLQTIQSYELGRIREGRPAIRRRIEEALRLAPGALLPPLNPDDPAGAGSSAEFATVATGATQEAM